MDRLNKKKSATYRRHLLRIQKVTRTPDGEGGFSDSWADVTPEAVWGSVEPIRAVQRAEYSSVGVEATHLIRVDGYVDIDEKYRVRFDQRYFEVLTVENLQERSFEQVCTCLERRNQINVV